MRVRKFFPDLLGNKAGRRFFAFIFYFAEGAPIGFIWWGMPTLLRKNGEDVDVIGAFIAALTLPWVFKFLWAPLIDILRNKRFGYSKWIGWSQTFMCLSLVPLLFIPLAGNTLAWGVLLFIHSLCAATQDVAIDAMIIKVVAEKEKGLLNGFMQAGMLTGRSLFGGGALLLLNELGLPMIIGLMIMVIFGISLLLVFVKEPRQSFSDKPQLKTFTTRLRSAFGSLNTWYTIGFALTGAAAFEAVGALSGPLLTDKGLSVEKIGFFFSVPAVASMLAGSLAGGYISDRFQRKKAITLFLLGSVITTILLSTADIVAPTLLPLFHTVLISVIYFFTGMFTSSSYALFMEASDPDIGATQFSTFMAATNGCEAWVVAAAGMVAASYGYGWAFLLMCLVSLFSLVFLFRVKKITARSRDRNF